MGNTARTTTGVYNCNLLEGLARITFDLIKLAKMIKKQLKENK